MLPPTTTVLDLIGNTPLLYLPHLSELYGVDIYGKAEYLNPGGSIKDRAAKSLVLASISSGSLRREGAVVEGTGGNTGVGLSLVSSALGHPAHMCMPSNASQEKQTAMKAFGATIEVCSTQWGSTDPGHYTQRAKSFSESTAGSVWTNQFLSLANYRAHYDGTGVEILRQIPGLDAFACGAGTGGTIAGVGRRIKVRGACTWEWSTETT